MRRDFGTVDPIIQPMKQALVAVGRVSRPQGNKGEVRVEPLTDFPERLLELRDVLLGDGSERSTPACIVGCRYDRRGFAVVKFEGVDDLASARRLKGLLVLIPRQRVRPLPKGQYYVFEVVGMEVLTEDGQQLGRVTEVARLPSNDIYVVQGSQGEILIPAVRDVVLRIDTQAGKITIRALPGLLEEAPED